MLTGESFPSWSFAILACVPNFVIGVLVIVFRSQITAMVKMLFPRLSSNGLVYVSRLVVVGGVVLMLTSSGILVSGLFSSSG